MAGEVLSRAIEGLQKGAEEYAKKRDEAQKAEGAAVGNRKLYDMAVQAGIFGPDEQIKYNKGNAQTKDSMIASAVRTFNVQQEQEAARVRNETLGIQKAQEARAKAQYEYRPGQDVYNAAAASDLNIIPQGPGQGFHLAPYNRPAWAPGPADYAKAAEQNRTYLQTPNGWTIVEKPPPTDKLYYPGTNIPVSTEGEAGKEILRSINPEAAIRQQYGLTPDDYLHSANVQFGSYDKKSGFDPQSADWSHVQIKGNTMPISEYLSTVRGLLQKGQTGSGGFRLVSPEDLQGTISGTPAGTGAYKPGSISYGAGEVIGGPGTPTGEVVPAETEAVRQSSIAMRGAPQAAAAPAGGTTIAAAAPAVAGGPIPLDPTNPTDMALVHTLLDQNNNDVDAAKAQAASMGRSWF